MCIMNQVSGETHFFLFICLFFKIGQSEVYLISPDTKKIALEKNFKEISFCSQVNADKLLIKF